MSNKNSQVNLNQLKRAAENMIQLLPKDHPVNEPDFRTNFVNQYIMPDEAVYKTMRELTKNRSRREVFVVIGSEEASLYETVPEEERLQSRLFLEAILGRLVLPAELAKLVVLGDEMLWQFEPQELYEMLVDKVRFDLERTEEDKVFFKEHRNMCFSWLELLNEAPRLERGFFENSRTRK